MASFDVENCEKIAVEMGSSMILVLLECIAPLCRLDDARLVSRSVVGFSWWLEVVTERDLLLHETNAQLLELHVYE